MSDGWAETRDDGTGLEQPSGRHARCRSGQGRRATVTTGYGNAGQVCISTQRVIVMDKVYDEFLDVLQPQVAALRVAISSIRRLKWVR